MNQQFLNQNWLKYYEKMRNADVLDAQGILRLIESIAGILHFCRIGILNNFMKK